MVDRHEQGQGNNTYRNEGEGSTSQEESMVSSFKVKYKNNIFQLFFHLNDLY